MFNIVTQNGNDARYLTRFLVDSVADLQAIADSLESSPGSTAIIADTGDEYMLDNHGEWFLYIKKNDGSGGGPGFTPRGTVASTDLLPLENNRLWDVFMVGPQDDGSYDEYYWTTNNQWELMGRSIPNLDDVIKKQVLYSGNDNTGTIEIPADGTILDYIYGKIDEIKTLNFKRLNAQKQEDDFINQISVLINNEVISSFYAPSTVVNAIETFVAEELVNYFTINHLVPTTYNGIASSQADIAMMTEANGPYLVLVTQTNQVKQYHVKNLHPLFQSYANKIDELEHNMETITDEL